MSKQNRIAVLFDGDNANCNLIENIFEKLNTYGVITVKRIYADWTMEVNKRWKEPLNTFAIRPIQKFAYTTGKNSSDTALIIDAMDLLYAQTVDTFCIVSSDSDYTGLAHRLREAGLNVIGIGKKTTPEAFRKACLTFIYEEDCYDPVPILTQEKSEQTSKKSIFSTWLRLFFKKSEKKEISKNNLKIEQQSQEIPSSLPTTHLTINYEHIADAFNQAKKNNIAYLPQFLEALKKNNPDFNYKSYGFSSFKRFCEQLENYQLVGNNQITQKEINLKMSQVNYQHIEQAFQNSLLNGKASLSIFFRELQKIDKQFHYKQYGYKSFMPFCHDLKGYKVVKSATDNSTMFIEKQK